MAYDSEDYVIIAGSAIHRSTIYKRLQPQGWDQHQVGNMSDEEVNRVLNQKLTPQSDPALAESLRPITPPQQQPPAVTTPPAPGEPEVRPGPVDINALDQQPDTEVMGTAPPPDVEPSIVTGGPTTQPSQSPAHPRRLDPTSVRIPGTVNRDREPPSAPTPTTPTTNHKQLLATLDAAARLVESSADTSWELLQSYSLVDAFEALHPESFAQLKRQLGDSVKPAETAAPFVGYTILRVEEHTGVLFLITDHGSVAIAGHDLMINHVEDPSS